MSHDVMKCPDCGSWIMEGTEDWWCDNCDAYYGSLSEWKWIKLERNSDKKLLKDIYELSCRRFNGAEFNLELLQKIRDISLSAFQNVNSNNQSENIKNIEFIEKATNNNVVIVDGVIKLG